MMATYHGKTGQGKTAGMTAAAYVDYLRGLDVQANYTLTFPKVRGAGKVRKLDLDILVDEDIELENLTLCLQEIYKIIDSRRSASSRNVIATGLFNQSRKRDMNVLGDAQMFSSVDTRLRGTVDAIALCKKYDKDGNRVRDPLWTDPEGYIVVQLYDPETIKPFSGASYPVNIGEVGKLYNTREKTRTVPLSDEV